ncbi:P-loop containing nucleoside triphosphate hydrolase protein [Plectosphaerella plurivora]|uniref:P-loop containing nucleoside triphosphate hydrolase protein n=1 Tax=Plectosphaerella plurivora TaxID=936078 RepID=A0A9P9A6I7_9PEZI|nr:P-loop containing nucleoside triphosphate hydrolase protein [Plectosphaerella plurivora]
MSAMDLQSKDHREILDLVDNLRSQGVSRYIDLPEIIVCGDQSAGKSSVLEAISGLSFPSKENLCTRFATELILRRDDEVKVAVSITPGPNRSSSRAEKLSSYDPHIDPRNPNLEPVIEGAKIIMGISKNHAFSSDILRIELAGNTEQGISGAPTVKRMVTKYMKRPRCIILAVVSAGAQFAVQEVTELARVADENGDRTMGLITKPDKLDAGSDMEKAYFELAQNKDVKFRLGWHVLKNRDFSMKNATSAERDAAEEEFFSKGLWKALGPRYCGIKSLKPRLSEVLKEQIVTQLPSLIGDIEVGIAECQEELEKLGSPRTTPGEQRQYLYNFSSRFRSLITKSIDGIYHEKFFGVAATDEHAEKRIRARIQEAIETFSQTMEANGEENVIVEVESSDDLKPREIERSVYLAHVKNTMKRNRGCELPGTFNPMIISELFRDQAQPWPDLVRNFKSRIVGIGRDAIEHIIIEVAAPDSVDSIRDIIFGQLQEIEKGLGSRFDKLVEQCTKGHAITYNETMIEKAQKAQAERIKKNMERKLDSSWNNNHMTKETVLLWMTEATESNTGAYAASLATDYMQAYYKVSLKRFIDDLSVQAIEHDFLQRLPDLFSNDDVHRLSNEEVDQIAAEGPESSVLRKNHNEKLAAFHAGLNALARLSKHGASFKRSRQVEDDAPSKRSREY